jgi:hypothetical protein
MKSPRNPLKKMELIGVDRWVCLKIEYSFPSTALSLQASAGLFGFV